MEDGRIFYIEIDGYDEKPELKILIGVDIFVNERGEILAEIPNRNKENFRDFQPDREKNDDDIDLEIDIDNRLLDNDEMEFKISASNKKGEAEEVLVKTIFPNGYELINVTNEFGEQTEELREWIKSGNKEWNVGTLKPEEQKIMVIKVKKLSQKNEKGLYRNFNFKAEILSYYNQEKKMKNNNEIVGDRVFVIKTIEKSFDSGAPSLGIEKRERKKTEDFIKQNANNPSAFTSDCIAYKNSIQIISEKFIRSEMVRIVEQDDGKQNPTAENNNREFGGYIFNGDVIEEKPGDVSILGTDEKATILLNSRGIPFHSHPSGYYHNSTKQTGQVMGNYTETIHMWNCAPSYKGGDIDNIEEGKIGYVFARRCKIVYMYNNKGVLATLPHKYFVEFKKK